MKIKIPIPQVNIKSPIFMVSCALVVVLLITFIFPKENWNKIFTNKINNTATVFQTDAAWTSSSSGNWASSTTWGIHTPRAMSYPRGIAIDPNYNIYTTNPSGYPLIILNPDGTASTTYGGLGSSLGNTLDAPGDIEITASGTIYLATGAARLVISEPGFLNPQTISDSLVGSLDVSNTGEIYVTQFESNDVRILNSDGTASTSYPISSSPWKIRFSEITNNIYVSINRDNQLVMQNIIVLSATGTEIANYPIPNTNFIISPTGELYVTDASTTIKIYNSDGTSSSTAPVYDIGAGNYASALSLAPNGKLYVTLSNLNSVIIFNSDGSIYGTYDGLTPDPTFIPVEGVDYPGINDTVILGQGTITLTGNQSIGNLTLATGATLDLNGYTLTIGHDGSYLNTGGTLITNGGNIIYLDDFTSVTSGPWNATSTWGIISTSTIEGLDYPGLDSNVIINTGTVTLQADQNIRNITLDAGGTLDLSGHTLNVEGNWTNTGGMLALNPGNEGTINLTSASTQSIIGNNTFENLIKISPSASSLNFETNSLTTITNNITLNGSSYGALLSIAPTGFTPPQFSGYFRNQSSHIGTEDGTMVQPCDIGFDSQNNIYIMDQTRHVQKFDSDENFITKFAPPGTTCDGCVMANLDGYLAIDSEDSIYVVSTFSNFSVGRILKFASTTATTSVIGSFANPPGDGEFYIIRGMAINPLNGDLYVSESNRVQVFNPDGSYKTQFGTYGSGDGQFWIPKSIAFNSNGDIYVQDVNNNRVQVFNPDFTFKSKFGTEGSGNGQFSNMYHGMVIDESNNIYVVDTGNNRVQIFNPDGTYKGQFGSYGTGEGQFNHPQGIAIDNNGVIYVGDTSNSRVVKFSYSASPQFNIIQQTDTDGINNFSFLSVTGSINLSTSSFYCTSCTNGGNNINWIIPSRRRSVIIPEVSTTTLSTSTSISIEPINATTTVGATTTFTSILRDQYDVILSTTTNWISENTSVGTIDTNGLFTAVSTGTSIIKVDAGGISTSTNITVVEDINISSLTEITEKTEELEEPKIETTPKPRRKIIVEIPIETISTTTMSTTTTATTSTTTATTTINEPSKNIVENITESIVAGYQNIIITPKDVEAVKEVINTEVGSAVTKTISTTGVVAGAAAGVSAVAFANPITFAELWLLPAKLFGLLLGALGIRRRNREWGTVYDSITKRPLDPVYVSLISVDTGKEVASAITDIDGRYGFLVLPGKYRIEAKKTNYIQPSVKMKGKSYDEVYNDLYFGEELTITQEGETITKNIPMDSLSFDWNEFAKTKMNVNKFTRQKDITWAKLSKLVFVIGALVSIIAVIAAPQPYNYIIVGFYFLAYILNFIVFKSKKSGTLTEKDTRAPLSFAIVKIYREGETVPLTKKIADKFGAYYALVPRGNYYISVEKKMDDGTYVEIFRSGVAEIKSGVIDEDLVL